MHRLMIVLLMVLALPARMAWADVMPIRMAATPDTASHAQAGMDMTDPHAHCHGAVDEVAQDMTGVVTEVSGDTGHDTAACAKCTVCHGLAIVLATSARGALSRSVVLQPAAMQTFSSVDLPARHKPPIS